MNLSLFDLHCDTASAMLEKSRPLAKNDFHVSLEKAAKFEQYIQVMAFFTSPKLDDEAGWNRFLAMRQNLLADPSVASGAASAVTVCPPRKPGVSLFFGIEDARIFAGRPERVEEAYRLGVRVLTPLWAKETCMGGSHDTGAGLTAFGRSAIERAISLGMIADISHASVKSADEIFGLAAAQKRPVIASHSNAAEICPVSRNLSREQIKNILASGGVIGLNLYTAFMKKDGNAAIADLLPHIEYFLEQGAENALCIGGDWDGADLPPELKTIQDISKLAELLLSRNYSETFVQKLFFENAYSFAKKNLK